MSVFDFGKPSKTLAELEEENEELRIKNENEELKLSLEDKKKLRKNGLNINDFGGSIKKAIDWIKTH